MSAFNILNVDIFYKNHILIKYIKILYLIKIKYFINIL